MRVWISVEGYLGDITTSVNTHFNKVFPGTIETTNYRASLNKTDKNYLDMLWSQPEPYESMLPKHNAQDILDRVRSDGDEPMLYTRTVHFDVLKTWLGKHFPSEKLVVLDTSTNCRLYKGKR